MLTKRQYGWTLLIASLVFFIAFMVTYWRSSQRVDLSSRGEVAAHQTLASSNGQVEEKKEEVKVAPYTKVWLKVQNLTTHKVDKEMLDTSSLLGLNREELAEQFADYVIETFNEREVCLKKEITPQLARPKTTVYVLGIADDYVCVKEKDTNKRPIKINYLAKHLSRYTYSVLLNEEISITSKQKEALLLNPNGLQKILQDYVGE